METLVLLAGKTTKSAIIRLLSAEWPISLRKIYFSIRKEPQKAITYQAVYKAVKELLDDGVLSKQEHQYMISPVWVEKSAESIGRLAEDYEKKEFGMTRKIQELNFGSLNDAWDFIVSKLNTDFFGESRDVYVQLRRFFLFPISKEDINRLKEFASGKKVHVMCRNNSLIDKIASGFLTSLGARVITGIECARPTNVLVIGNCVVSFYILGEKERAKLSDYYMKAAGMRASEAGLFNSFNNIFLKRVRVKLIINCDPEVLSDVLEQTKAILSRKPH